MSAPRIPHPIIFSLLYLPFGALSGFVSVALTFMGKESGLSISDTSLLIGANLLTGWMKWVWAPMVDATLSPKKWYLFATTCSAIGVFTMAAVPMNNETLPILLGVITAASLINSIVGMSIEAIMAVTTTETERGRVSAWFQAGNLGGSAFGGALGLILLQELPSPWMAGAIMAGTFLACCTALRWVPDVRAHVAVGGVLRSTFNVFGELWAMLKTRPGMLSALLCTLPLGTGAVQGVLGQDAIAGYWGAGAREVALVQGLLAGALMTAGCFVGGWLCDRLHPRTAYAAIGLALAFVAVGMGVSPATITMYVGWNMLYSFGVGIAYAAFTAVVLSAMGTGAGATKYSFFASLSNFPIWWLGLLLGRVADSALGTAVLPKGGGEAVPAGAFDVWLAGFMAAISAPLGATSALYCEAVFGVIAVGVFVVVVKLLGGSRSWAVR